MNTVLKISSPSVMTEASRTTWNKNWNKTLKQIASSCLNVAMGLMRANKWWWWWWRWYSYGRCSNTKFQCIRFVRHRNVVEFHRGRLSNNRNFYAVVIVHGDYRATSMHSAVFAGEIFCLLDASSNWRSSCHTKNQSWLSPKFSRKSCYEVSAKL